MEIKGGFSEEHGSGTSIFDPVLCELVYSWFSPPDGVVLDPFAGGSVRGIVAAMLGRRYTGIELRPEQIAANQEQAVTILSVAKGTAAWIEGDSMNLDGLLNQGQQFDLVFSCPPYGDLEVYSDDPRDLSTLPADEFFTRYRAIIAASVARLRQDRFACFVVGDYRDKQGFYRSLPAETVRAFEDAGARLYNDAVLITAVGSLPLRVVKMFTGSRKLGKTHQNVLVFCKGDPKKAAAACGPVDMSHVESLLGLTPEREPG